MPLSSALLLFAQPIGSPYPGNAWMAVFACFCGFGVSKFALVAYRKKKNELLVREAGPGWESYAGLALVFLGGLIFAVYAISKNSWR
jgi:hypothetical protein